MAAELYGDLDPIDDFHAASPFRVIEGDSTVTLELDVPFVEKSDLEVYRHGHELYIQLGAYRRSFLLPDALHRREVTRARLEEGTLRVAFGEKARR
jgi:arsenite-transporting ATPase